MIVRCQMCGAKLATIKPKNGDLIVKCEKGIPEWKVQLHGSKKNRELIVDPEACADCFRSIVKEQIENVFSGISEAKVDEYIAEHATLTVDRKQAY